MATELNLLNPLKLQDLDADIDDKKGLDEEEEVGGGLGDDTEEDADDGGVQKEDGEDSLE